MGKQDGRLDVWFLFGLVFGGGGGLISTNFRSK